ncbi:MAG TPA: TAXI family TRAP transporter solute-binding subunit [Alphaproteobacteria bacterium]|nr:TAXI family TRAP transporter solute-binding subunit [Alphaproteobacteria bacterium]
MAGGSAFAAALSAGVRSAAAQEPRFFRIATGPVDSSYFGIGTLIGNVVSSPPGARECERGGSCGVPGLIAVTQTTAGPLANIEAIANNRFESALCQADIAYWAFHGSGMFRKQGAVTNLRAIAGLYPETMHIVARADRKIDDLRRLRGKTVSMGEPNSSTQLTAKAMLQTLGIPERDIKVQNLAPAQAMEALREGKLDAFFLMTGVPAPEIRDLAGNGGIALVPIDSAGVRKLSGAFPFFAEAAIPSQAYPGVPETPSLSVVVLWVVGAEVDEKIVYGLTRALFHPNNRRALDTGHPYGRLIRRDRALDGVALQLHAGAALYYFEEGLIR